MTDSVFNCLCSGSPAEGYLHPLSDNRMVTNVDARANARKNYHHQIIKYQFHTLAPQETFHETPLSTQKFTHMAQSHGKTTAGRWLKDYLGEFYIIENLRLLLLTKYQSL